VSLEKEGHEKEDRRRQREKASVYSSKCANGPSEIVVGRSVYEDEEEDTESTLIVMPCTTLLGSERFDNDVNSPKVIPVPIRCQ
jgi:hypothetical protein